MHRPEKRGPVLKAERPWEGSYVTVFCPPMWIPEEGVYRQVYECRDEKRAGMKDGQIEHRYAIAVSADGMTWEKPNVGLVEFDGSKRNNLFPTPDMQRLAHVVFDPDDEDPRRRYKGLMTIPHNRVPVVSADCLNWTTLDSRLPSGDAGTLTFDRSKRMFMAMLKRPNRGTAGRSYDVSLSTNFNEWSEPRFMFGMDDERDQEMARETIRRRLADPAPAKPLFVDPDPETGWCHPDREHHTPTWRAECYNFGVVPYEGVYLGLITVYYPTGQRLPDKSNTDGFNLIQLAVSRDLEEWVRIGERRAFLGPSPLTDGLVGNYDRLQLGAHNGIIPHGDELRFYYAGTKRRVPQHDRWTDGRPRDPSTLSSSERADWLEDNTGAVCLGVLRRDGFVSLDAGPGGGYLLTKPVRLHGSRLFLNLQASEGVAHVELLSEDGVPVDGFSGDHAAAVRGDGVRLEVHWDSGKSAGSIGDRPVRLRIRLKQAELYSVWSEEPAL